MKTSKEERELRLSAVAQSYGRICFTTLLESCQRALMCCLGVWHLILVGANLISLWGLPFFRLIIGSVVLQSLRHVHLDIPNVLGSFICSFDWREGHLEF